jgi:hypothetical protein
MMNRFALLAIAICLTLLVSQGCMSHSDFTVISSKNINVSNVKIATGKSKGQTQGRHCHYAVLFFTIGEPTNLEKALDAALLAKRAEVLIDAEVNWQFVWIPFIYTQECWKVEGTAYDIF